MNQSRTHRTVTFVGSRSGTGNMTWSQQWMWHEVLWFAPHHQHLNVQTLVEVPETATIETVLRSLQVTIERREPLRTVYGRPVTTTTPQQTVLARGQLTVEIREVAVGDSRTIAETFANDLSKRAFAEADLPIRAGIVTQNGRPRQVVLVLFHMATDGWDIETVTAELAQLFRQEGANDSGQLKPHPLQPLDLAARQNGPEGQRTAWGAIQYWREQLTYAPSDMLPARRYNPDDRRFREIRIESELLAVATATFTRRLGITEPTVLLSFIAVLLGIRSGNSTCFLTTYFHNRLSKELASAPGIYVQDIPVMVNLVDATFLEIARRVWDATVSAYAFGQYDPVQVTQLIREIGQSRGASVTPSCTVNLTVDNQRRPHGLTDLEPNIQSIAAAKVKTRVHSESTMCADRPGRKFYLVAAIYDRYIRISLRVDTAFISRDESITFLQDLDRLAEGVLLNELIDLHAQPGLLLQGRW